MWLHHDWAFSIPSGLTYSTQLAGSVPIKCSMKELEFSTRCMVAQFCIDKVCQKANLPLANNRDSFRSNYSSTILNMCDGPVFFDEYSGVDGYVSITFDKVIFMLASSEKVFRQHAMSNILFTFCDDYQTRYASLVVEEPALGRFCLVLSCAAPEAARCITATLGQAFNLRYEQAKVQASTSTNSTVSQASLALCQNSMNANASSLNNASSPSIMSPNSLLAQFVAYSNHFGGLINKPIINVDQVPWFNIPTPRAKPKCDSIRPVRIIKNIIGEIIIHSDLYYYLIFEGDEDYILVPSLTVDDRTAMKNYLETTNGGLMLDNVLCSKPNHLLPSLSEHSGKVNSSSVMLSTRPCTRSMSLRKLATLEVSKSAKFQLEEQGWYHGTLSQAGTSLLVIHEGEFLVRVSQAKRDQVVLSGMNNGDLHHVILVDKDGSVRKFGGIRFESIVDLIEHHMSTKEPITTFGGVILYLTKPVVNKYSN